MEDALELIVDAHASLGESPVWDERQRQLWWVDLLGGIVHATDPVTGEDLQIPVDQPIGAIALRESGPPILAVRDGYATLDPSSGRLDLIAPIAPDDPGIRMNDGKVGPDGGFWAGSMAADEGPGRGRLHRLDPDGTVTEVLADLTIPNGLDWTADGRELLFIDTPTRRVDRFDVDPTGRAISGRRPAVEIATGHGWPDGMTIDAEGIPVGRPVGRLGRRAVRPGRNDGPASRAPRRAGHQLHLRRAGP